MRLLVVTVVHFHNVMSNDVVAVAYTMYVPPALISFVFLVPYTNIRWQKTIDKTCVLRLSNWTHSMLPLKHKS